MFNMDDNNALENTIEERKGFFSKKVVIFLYGLLLILLSVIPFFNLDGLSSFLLYVFAYCFGVYTYLILVLLALLGLYLMVARKLPKLKLNFAYLGFIFLILYACIVSSYKIPGLTIADFPHMFNDAVSSVSSNLKLNSVLDIGELSGGFLGYMFGSIFVTGLGEIGTLIFCILFLLIGSVLIIRRPIIALCVFLRDLSSKRKDKRTSKEEAIHEETSQSKVETSVDTTPSPILKTGVLFSDSPNLTSGVKIEQVEPSKTRTGLFHSEEQEEFKMSTSAPVSPFFKEYQLSKNRIENNKEKEESLKVNEEKAEMKKEDASNLDRAISPFASSTPLIREEDSRKEETEEKEKEEETIEIEDKEEEIIQEEKQEEIKPEVKDMSFASKQPSPLSSSTLQASDEAIRPSKKEKPSPVNAVTKPFVFKKYPFPSISLLDDVNDYGKLAINQQAAQDKIDVINGVFYKLGIGAHVYDYTIGPSVTRFNIDREPGVKISEITNQDVLSECQVDLCGDMSVRIEGVVQGQKYAGIEVGNPSPMTVSFKEAFAEVMKSDDKLTFPIGKNISNKIITASLNDMPHLLIAGTTGSGKSVFVHSILMSLIMRNYPDELKLILIDPKKVEFVHYLNIPHLYCPISDSVVDSVAILKKLCAEMERRYTILSRYSLTKLQSYHKLCKERPELENLPFIVCVIDEFADLMGQDPKNVESYTQRLAQKARAAGIYLIIATQRPTVKVITGTIKSNIPARVSLYLPSGVDSRTILDEIGAETLLGHGDLLARIPALKSIVRLQSAFVTDEDMSRVVSYLKQQCAPQFNPEFLNFETSNEEGGEEGDDSAHRSSGFDDELYPDIKRFVIENHVASTSFLQRKFSIGYSRAASLLDALEEDGVIRTVGANNRKEVVATSDDIDID